MDFTIKIYQKLLDSWQKIGYVFQTFKAFSVDAPIQMSNALSKPLIILRHDVDKMPQNSLMFSKIQAERGINGTYYFRTVKESWDEAIIKEIVALGHEVGYHYETMDSCHGNIDKAYDEFCRNLEKFRKFVNITTICMHGSPLSKFDNRVIWSKYDYRSLGIIGEPYFDLDFNKTYYLTDTGRRWDGQMVSLRDKAMSTNPITNPDFLNRSYHSTSDIIDAIERDDFPTPVMMTFHPQRWTDNKFLWGKEFIVQNLKNQIKHFLVK